MENAVSDNLLDYSSDDFYESPPAVHTSRSRGGFKHASEFIVAESSSAASKRRPVASKRIPAASDFTMKKTTTPEVPTTTSKPSTSVTTKDPKIISKRVIAVKTTAKNIWKPLYLQPLYDLVNTTNSLVTHTFALTKYIYLQELAANETFTLRDFVEKDFFVEVFLSLTLSKARNTRLKPVTKKYRQLIAKYKEAYFQDANYTPPSLPNAQQIALYECSKIQTAYHNNIKAHFGNRLRQFINIILQKKEQANNLRKEMKENGSDDKAIKTAIQNKIYGPCNQISRAVAKKEIPAVSILDDQSRKELNSIFSCYPKDYNFQKDSIYYDIAAKPENHFAAFFKLAKLVEARTGKLFICFPLRTSFIPCYMTLDAKIINFHILNKSPLQAGKKFKIWGSVVNFEKKAFKNQGVDKTLRFQGTLETDGVGVSIIKQNTDTSRKFFTTSVKTVVDDQEQYIEGLNQANLKRTENKCVLIDPGRRDLLYCMKETSTVEEKQTLIFTKNNRSKCSRHFRYLRNQNKPLVVQEAETTLSKTESKSLNLTNYIQYIKARSSVNDTLTGYYGNETLKPKETYFPQSEFSFCVDYKCNLYYGNLFISRICGFFPQSQNFSNDRIVNPQFYAVYLQIMLSQKHILQRLDDGEKRRILALGVEINRRPNQSDLNRKTLSAVLEKLQLLPFRKMKFSSKMFYEQNDQKLVQNLKRKFGPDAVLVLGNWSAPNTKFQEPTRNKGLIQMLKKMG